MPKEDSPPAKEAWRQYLLHALNNDKELAANLAETIGVKVVTIWRYANGETTPHQPFRTLLTITRALPENMQTAFINAIREQYPDFQLTPLKTGLGKPLPAEFYAYVMEACALVEDSLASWTIFNLLAQQLYQHLDPDLSGRVVITFLRCTPPAPETKELVRSFYSPVEQSTERKNPLKQPYPLFFGMETALYWCLLSQDGISLRGDEIPPELVSLGVQSMSAHAIQKRGRVSGMIVLTSAKEEFFNSARLQLLREYANLALIAFEDRAFYPLEHISLALYPSLTQQMEHEKRYPFRQRGLALRFSHPEANQSTLGLLALWQLEQELIQGA